MNEKALVGRWKVIKLPHEKFPELKEKREKVDNYCDKLLEAGQNAVGYKKLYNMDFLVIGVVKRSVDLVGGFILTIDNWNFISAAPIIRMQLDTLLRLIYISKISPKEAEYLINHIMDGKRLNHLKDPKGKKLNDSLLRKYAEKYFPRVNDVYEQTSKFIHFSERHMFGSIYNINNKKRIVKFAIYKGSYNVQKQDVIEYYDVFITITDTIIKFINTWGTIKRGS